jgi:NAD(P)-dependent dehydrogenase (short-subunit alcohol dehydrogenase family)
VSHSLVRLLLPDNANSSLKWLAGAYSKAGITVNGVAPALIQDTKMLPGNNEELAKSESTSNVLTFGISKRLIFIRNSNRTSRIPRRDR